MPLSDVASDNPVLKRATWSPKHALWYMIRGLLRRGLCMCRIIRLNWSDNPTFGCRFIRCCWVFSTWPPICTAQCTGDTASVHPVQTGYSGDHAPVDPVLLVSELVHFNFSLSSFFVFCFVRAFYFILETWWGTLDKHISLINCVVIWSPKSLEIV